MDNFINNENENNYENEIENENENENINEHEMLWINAEVAIATGNIEELENILDRSPDLINEKSRLGKGLIHYAFDNCSRISHDTILEMVEFLVDKGTDVNIQDNAGRTPLITAFHKKCYGILSDLIDILNKNKKLDINLTENSYYSENYTILHHIIDKWEWLIDEIGEKRALTLLKKVLKLGADPSMKAVIRVERGNYSNKPNNGKLNVFEILEETVKTHPKKNYFEKPYIILTSKARRGPLIKAYETGPMGLTVLSNTKNNTKKNNNKNNNTKKNNNKLTSKARRDFLIKFYKTGPMGSTMLSNINNNNTKKNHKKPKYRINKSVKKFKGHKITKPRSTRRRLHKKRHTYKKN